AERDGEAVAGAGVGVARRLVGAPVATGGEADDPGVEGVDLAREHLIGHDAADLAVRCPDEIEHLELVGERDLVPGALVGERREHRVAGAVGGVAGAAHGRLAEVARVPAEAALADLALLVAAERDAVVLELDDGARRVLAQHLDRVLVAEVVRALDAVEHVPEPGVLLLVAQRSGDAALGSAGVAAQRVELGDDGDVGPALAGVEGRHQAGPAGPYDHDVVRKDHGLVDWGWWMVDGVAPTINPPPSTIYRFSPATVTEYVPTTSSTSARPHERAFAKARAMSL